MKSARYSRAGCSPIDSVDRVLSKFRSGEGFYASRSIGSISPHHGTRYGHAITTAPADAIMAKRANLLSHCRQVFLHINTANLFWNSELVVNAGPMAK